jgi:hypothetical protein
MKWNRRPELHFVFIVFLGDGWGNSGTNFHWILSAMGYIVQTLQSSVLLHITRKGGFLGEALI